MKNRNTAKLVALFTNPVSAVGHALQNKMIPIGILGPYLSQKGPSTNRMTIVPTDAAIDDVQISESLICNVFWTSFNNGVIENLSKELEKI